MVKCRLFFILCLVFAMTGCAGHKMALSKGQSDIDLTKGSITLLSVKVSNEHKPSYQLDLTGVKICPQSETCSRPLPYFHKAEAPYKTEKDHFNEFLLSFGLESGTYNLEWIGTTYQTFLVSGFGSIPIYTKIDIKPNSIIYLGHLDVVLRERKNDNEKRAGNILPLVDQAVPGYSSGTFDVIVKDKFDEDMQSFIKEYPGLQKVKVDKSILPQWIRPEKRTTN